MSPSTRRHATLLLWLMLALLPLRGWAMGVMTVAATPSQANAVSTHPAGCHEGSTDAAANLSDALCNVCHAAAAPAPDVKMPEVDTPVHGIVRWATQSKDEERPAGPYKPPRR